MSTPNFYICAHAPKDVINLQVDNFGDENDDERPHLDIVLRFAEANGADIDEVNKGRGLPTTRAWVDWLTKTALNESWIAGIAATRVGTESQSPLLYSKVLPTLREKYKYSEDEIEHFWLHSEVDIESMAIADFPHWSGIARRASCKTKRSTSLVRAPACAGSISTAYSFITNRATICGSGAYKIGLQSRGTPAL